ncbi:cation:proton antiporter [Azospirillum halopraeferens]|uniref:cation:proton antiporter n=1 Tax=Azospirillum halopraeferens TaxID=34010 RepID=UPI0003FA819F|nr:cation:proton antiporter [Azospirillum halopraeferens]
MFEFHSMFDEVAALLVLACVIGLIGMFLRQPLIVSFLAVGIVAGPDVLGMVQSLDHVELLAEIGIAVLLFLVGLKLDIQLVTSLGAVAVATGVGQVLFTSAFGFALCLMLGLDPVASLYVAVALTFSSTIIVVKLLSDKREIDSLHGRIALGFLIVQDIAVVVAMVALSAVGIGAESGDGSWGVAGVLAGGVVMLAGVGLFIRYVAEPLLRRLARVPELLVTFAIGWAVALAALGDWMGFGKELGGLLAGVSLASSSYREAVASRLTSLRDFLLLFFFIGLGVRLDLEHLGAQVPSAMILSAFVLIGNPLIVLAIMGYMGYRKRTGFLAGLTVAQISEFSLIFIAMGVALGHVGGEAVGLVTLVGMVTITLSTYMIVYSHELYAMVERFLSPFERTNPHREEEAEEGVLGDRYEVVLFGLGRYGREIAKGLLARGVTVLGIDFDPEALRRWKLRGQPGLYGDAGDPDFLAALPLTHASWVVVAIPPAPGVLSNADPRVALVHGLRDAGFRGRIALTCHDARDRKQVLRHGADLALAPFMDAAARAVEMIVDDAGTRDGPREAVARTG